MTAPSRDTSTEKPNTETMFPVYTSHARNGFENDDATKMEADVLCNNSNIEDRSGGQSHPESTHRHNEGSSQIWSKPRDSLERKITELITKDASHGLSTDETGVGATFILRDLVETSIKTRHAQFNEWIQNERKEFTSRMDHSMSFKISNDSNVGSVDSMVHRSVGSDTLSDPVVSKKSASDVFDSDTGESDWATFDDQTMMGGSFFSTVRDLDKDGFPLTFGSTCSNEFASKECFESEPRPVVSKKIVTQRRLGSSTSSCGESTTQFETFEKSTHILIGDCSTPKSPSSVTNFVPKSSPNSGKSSRLTWNPQPPKHLNHHAIEGETIEESTTASF